MEVWLGKGDGECFPEETLHLLALNPSLIDQQNVKSELFQRILSSQHFLLDFPIRFDRLRSPFGSQHS